MYKSIDDALAWASKLQMSAPTSDHHIRAVDELWPIVETLGIKTALEVGTGEPPGMVVTMLRKHGIDAIGMDIQSDGNDMHSLPYADNSFDLVVSRHSLEHVLIPYVALFEMKRVSKKWLLVVVPPESDKALDWPDHLNCYSQRGWTMMFNRVGLYVQHYEEGDHTEDHAKADNLWKDIEHRFLLLKQEGK